ncbi:hypothetical protein IMZ31_19285 (plasmid) [Pontibacillus sp. ALD_SL1]|uniref:hypothetical protein n=1 Tax=Pontibacillus sp. ALD_SL1 TaxID=2777185 RepID=UPI001A95EF98|nr:hypothetical protein [Pontibacillus sp. ALD_SL1]QST02694.1 hypothetical protein IMZ31_19285 [Pontibacillus sp. ALD_SL1]
MNVILVQDDMDRIAGEKRYGVGIYPCNEQLAALEHEDDLMDRLLETEVLERVYGPSEDAAFHNAEMVCKEEGYTIVTI